MKQKILITSLISLPIRIYLGLTFLLACFHKIAYPANFALDIASYQFLPLYFINIFAIILPILELISGVCIIIGLKTRAAAILIAGMMVMFIIALIWALHLGLDMPCGCFASETINKEDPISYLTILRDLGWLALSLYVILFDKTPIGVDYFLERKKVENE